MSYGRNRSKSLIWEKNSISLKFDHEFFLALEMSHKKAPICSFERTLFLGSIKKKPHVSKSWRTNFPKYRNILYRPLALFMLGALLCRTKVWKLIKKELWLQKYRNKVNVCMKLSHIKFKNQNQINDTPVTELP